jgi:phage gpG-like protein
MRAQIDNDRRVLRRFEQLADRGDLTKIAPKIGRQFYKIERQLFSSQGATGASGKWTKLSDATLAQKRRSGQRTKILQAQGDLRASLTGPNHGDSIRRVSSDVIELGTQRSYAKYHQSKKPRQKNARGRDRLPRRPILDLTDEQKRGFRDTIREYVLTGNRSGS